MKKIKTIFAGLFFVLLSTGVMAQGGPPDPPGGHGDPGDQPPAGAPISGGMFLLLGMAAVYGGKKWIDYKRTEKSKAV